MKSIFLLTFFCSLFTMACSPKVSPTSAKNYLTAKEVYTQKEIPAQPNSSIQEYLKIEIDLEDTKDVIIDEVVFRGKSYLINSSQTSYRLNLASGSIHKKETSLADNEAMVIYTYKGKNMVLTLRNIEEKPPLYLE